MAALWCWTRCSLLFCVLQSCEGKQVEIVIPHRREFSSEGLHKLERCHQGESCDFHKSTAAALSSRVDMADMLSKQAATEKQHNRQYLLKVSSCQGLVMPRPTTAWWWSCDETNSNLHQLLFLWGWRLFCHQSISWKAAAKVHCPRSPK